MKNTQTPLLNKRFSNGHAMRTKLLFAERIGVTKILFSWFLAFKIYYDYKEESKPITCNISHTRKSVS